MLFSSGINVTPLGNLFARKLYYIVLPLSLKTYIYPCIMMLFVCILCLFNCSQSNAILFSFPLCICYVIFRFFFILSQFFSHNSVNCWIVESVKIIYILVFCFPPVIQRDLFWNKIQTIPPCFAFSMFIKYNALISIM